MTIVHCVQYASPKLWDQLIRNVRVSRTQIVVHHAFLTKLYTSLDIQIDIELIIKYLVSF
jgi:hypothetical protein